MLRCFIAIGLAFLLFLPEYPAAQEIDPGAVRVGDRWSYDVKDDLTGDFKVSMTFEVVEVNEKEITTRVHYRGKPPPRTMIFDLDWGRIDDGLWKVRPHGIGIKKPLEVGKKWRSRAQATNMRSGVVLRASGVAKVAGQEQVTTPAGTFDAFRVEMRVRSINTKDQTKSSIMNLVVWYAPAVNRWVKRKVEKRAERRLRDSYVEELTEYSRKF